MANFQSAIREEIRRLARQEAKRQIDPIKKQSALHRRDIAALKRVIDQQMRELGFLRRQEKKRLTSAPATAAAESVDQQIRFSPAWLKKHRAKLGLSAEDYGKLIDVSKLSIYKWEGGKTNPRQSQKAKLAAIRGIGKREALKRLEMIAAK